ncbi:hypothetical protein JZO86_14290 [Enterococcus ureasiticus]|uniref:hypothetical protein n=1 Tax=Enterococcus ureasiticus TaxID=903984 RepID=UPI001A8D5438|nr:hypothetical protein [Enterococcus ureasiticus]MBO0474868.1 hypothetical protein [Enterococcus ureasiticus]
MSQTVKPFDELRVRGFPYDKKVRLMRMAKTENKSLQKFLYDTLIRLADNQEVMDVQYQMSQLQKETNGIVEQNTIVIQEIKDVLNYIAGVE